MSDDPQKDGSSNEQLRRLAIALAIGLTGDDLDQMTEEQRIAAQKLRNDNEFLDMVNDNLIETRLANLQLAREGLITPTPEIQEQLDREKHDAELYAAVATYVYRERKQKKPTLVQVFAKGINEFWDNLKDATGFGSKPPAPSNGPAPGRAKEE